MHNIKSKKEGHCNYVPPAYYINTKLSDISDMSYLSPVAFSNRPMIEKINTAERRQHVIRTPQNATSDILSQKKPITPTSRLPIAVAASQPPCISPLYCGGDTFETNDNPIGLRNNSATVRPKYVPINHPGDTSLSDTPEISDGAGSPIEPTKRITNATAARIIPIPILRGAEGSLPFFASDPKSATVRGVSITINIGLNC